MTMIFAGFCKNSFRLRQIRMRRQLLTNYAEHSLSSRNSVGKLPSTFWLLHDNAQRTSSHLKSFVAQYSVRDRRFVLVLTTLRSCQSELSSRCNYYYLILPRNSKSHLRRTRFADDESPIATPLKIGFRARGENSAFKT